MAYTKITYEPKETKTTDLVCREQVIDEITEYFDVTCGDSFLKDEMIKLVRELPAVKIYANFY